MLTYDIKWISPIHVSLLGEEASIVEGPLQALAALHDDGLGEGGKHHQIALHECKLACHELGRSEKAREAFMAAALEAGVLSSARARGRIKKTTQRQTSLLPQQLGRSCALPI